MKTQGEYVNTRVFNGTMSINEAKAFFDENLIDGGDVRMVPVNMQTVERMIEGPEEMEAPETDENETNGEKDN